MGGEAAASSLTSGVIHHVVQIRPRPDASSSTMTTR